MFGSMSRRRWLAAMLAGVFGLFGHRRPARASAAAAVPPRTADPPVTSYRWDHGSKRAVSITRYDALGRLLSITD